MIVWRVAAVTVIVVSAVALWRVAWTPVVPAPMPVARPCEPAALLIVAMVAVSVVQATLVVMSSVEPSEYVPVAVNCSVVPTGVDGVAGVMEIHKSVAGVTVTVAEPLTAPSAAVMLAVPADTAVTVPCEPAAFDTAAVPDALDDHVTLSVRSAVEPSE
jgi:hypothetical protein